MKPIARKGTQTVVHRDPDITQGGSRPDLALKDPPLMLIVSPLTLALLLSSIEGFVLHRAKHRNVHKEPLIFHSKPKLNFETQSGNSFCTSRAQKKHREVHRRAQNTGSSGEESGEGRAALLPHKHNITSPFWEKKGINTTNRALRRHPESSLECTPSKHTGWV